MTRMLASLRRNERGASVIEMGLAAPFLAFLLIGMVDLSRAYSTKLQLEQVAQRTVERVQNTDYKPSQDATLEAEAAAAAGVNATAADVTAWLECNNGGAKLSFTASCADASHPYARYVEIEIEKTFTPMFSTRFAGANANGTYTLRGTAGVRVQ